MNKIQMIKDVREIALAVRNNDLTALRMAIHNASPEIKDIADAISDEQYNLREAKDFVDAKFYTFSVTIKDGYIHRFHTYDEACEFVRNNPDRFVYGAK